MVDDFKCNCQGDAGICCTCCLKCHTSNCEIVLLAGKHHSSNPDWICCFCLRDIFPFNHITDGVEFKENVLPVSHEFNKVEIISHIAQSLNVTEEDTNNERDPNVNFPQLCQECHYILPEDFTHKYYKDGRQDFSLLHINCRSLNKNSCDVEQLFNSLNYPFSVVGLTETWISDHSLPVFSIQGYEFIHLDRKTCRGGGLGFLVSSTLTYLIRNDLNVITSTQECFAIEITVSRGKNIVILVIYRPPSSSVVDFNTYFDDILQCLTKENKHLYIMGDFNLDLLKSSSNTRINTFLNNVYANGLTPMINKPTRLTKTTASLIDNIFINSYTSNVNAGIIYSDVSDHLPVFVVLNNAQRCYEYMYDKGKKKRQINDNTKKSFFCKLSSEEWTDVYRSKDPNVAYEIFFSNFQRHYNESFTFVRSNKKNKNKKLWVSLNLLTKIRLKNKLYKRFCCNPTYENEEKYKKIRNKVSSELRKAKKMYFYQRFNDCKSDLKKTWRLINSIFKKRKPILPQHFIHEGRTLNDPQLISSVFNDYFNNIGPKLASSIDATDL